jgi:hypothetical protein
VASSSESGSGSEAWEGDRQPMSRHSYPSPAHRARRGEGRSRNKGYQRAPLTRVGALGVADSSDEEPRSARGRRARPLGAGRTAPLGTMPRSNSSMLFGEDGSSSILNHSSSASGDGAVSHSDAEGMEDGGEAAVVPHLENRKSRQMARHRKRHRYCEHCLLACHSKALNFMTNGFV